LHDRCWFASAARLYDDRDRLGSETLDSFRSNYSKRGLAAFSRHGQPDVLDEGKP